MPLRDITNVIRQPAADWVKPVSAGTPAASAGVVEQSQSAHQQRSDLSLPVIDFLKDSFAATMSVVTDDHTSVSDEATAVCTAPTSSEQNKRSTQKVRDGNHNTRGISRTGCPTRTNVSLFLSFLCCVVVPVSSSTPVSVPLFCAWRWSRATGTWRRATTSFDDCKRK